MSKEAFDRFGTWKKSRTVLKLTVLTKGGMPEIRRGRISSFDMELRLVALAVSATRDFATLDLNGANFRVGKRMVEVTRGEEDFLLFEEE